MPCFLVDVSWNALRGMVAAHRNAQLVGLSKWALRCKHPEDFEQLFVAVANGSKARYSRHALKYGVVG